MEISVNSPFFCLIFFARGREQKGVLLYRCEEDLDLVEEGLRGLHLRHVLCFRQDLGFDGGVERCVQRKGFGDAWLLLAADEEDAVVNVL